MTSSLQGVSVWQVGRAVVPEAFIRDARRGPGSFVRHFWPIVAELDDWYWTELPLSTEATDDDPDYAALLQLLQPDEQPIPPRTVFPEFAAYVGGGWADFYGFRQPPPWTFRRWRERCRPDRVDPAVGMHFMCFEGDAWVMRSRDERLLATMKDAAATHARYLAVADAEPLPVAGA